MDENEVREVGVISSLVQSGENNWTGHEKPKTIRRESFISQHPVAL